MAIKKREVSPYHGIAEQVVETLQDEILARMVKEVEEVLIFMEGDNLGDDYWLGFEDGDLKHDLASMLIAYMQEHIVIETKYTFQE